MTTLFMKHKINGCSFLVYFTRYELFTLYLAHTTLILAFLEQSWAITCPEGKVYLLANVK